MSIRTEIDRIVNNISLAYDECDAKGATMPLVRNSQNLAACIASITGGGSTGYPSFSYTGTYNFYDEGNDNWHLELLSGGTLSFSSMGASIYGIDSFVVGGGGGGGRCTSRYYGGCGGNGGCVYTGSQFFPVLGTNYTATVGVGGDSSANGSASSIFGYSAPGGLTQTGTGSSSRYHTAAPSGYTSATNGGDGGYSSNNATNGSDGVYPFGVSGMTGCNFKYGASGGGGAGYNSSSKMTNAGTGGSDGGGNGANSQNGSGTAGTANRGAGGGGGTATSGYGGAGGSGIIILRNHRI